MQRIDHFPEPFDSGDFKFQKIAFTKLQLEAGNGYQLYKSVHKNGKKKSNLFVKITVDKISLTLCAFFLLISVTRYIFQFEKFKVSSFCLQRYATSWNIYWSTTNRELDQGRWPKTDC